MPAPGTAAGDPLRALDSEHAFTALSPPLGPRSDPAALFDDITDTAPSTRHPRHVARPTARPVVSPVGASAPAAAKVVVGPELALRVGTGEDTGP